MEEFGVCVVPSIHEDVLNLMVEEWVYQEIPFKFKGEICMSSHLIGFNTGEVGTFTYRIITSTQQIHQLLIWSFYYDMFSSSVLFLFLDLIHCQKKKILLRFLFIFIFSLLHLLHSLSSSIIWIGSKTSKSRKALTTYSYLHSLPFLYWNPLLFELESP